MAESQIAGLFMTPEMYQRQQMQADRQRAAEYAQLDPEQRAAMGFFSAGQGLGRAAGTLLGAQDPQLQRITEQQQLLQGLDVADPESLMEAARRASQTGNTPLAMQLAGRAQEVAQGLAATQKAQLSLAQERELRAKLAALPPNATDEDRLAIYSQYAPAGQAVQALTAQVGRREAIASREAEAERNREARREALELQLQGRLDLAKMQGATQAQIAQMQIDGRKQIAEIMAGVRREIAAAGAGSGGAANRPAPMLKPALQKEEDKDLESIDLFAARASALEEPIKLLTPDPKTGRVPLQLGPILNLQYQALNAAGRSSPESRAYASLQRSVQEATNLKTDAAKGVQTDRDVLRFANELIAAFGKNDTKVMLEALQNFKKSTETATENTRRRLDARRTAQGVEPVFARQSGASTGGGAGALGTPGNPIKLD